MVGMVPADLVLGSRRECLAPSSGWSLTSLTLESLCLEGMPRAWLCRSLTSWTLESPVLREVRLVCQTLSESCKLDSLESTEIEALVVPWLTALNGVGC